MSSLMALEFLVKIAGNSRATLEESDKKYEHAAPPNTGQQLEDVEDNAKKNYNTTPKPDAYYNYPDHGIQRGGWYSRGEGNGSFSVSQNNPTGSYNKKHNYIFDAPAQSMLGTGGNSNTDNFFNYNTGKYEALNSNGRYNMGGTESMRNSLYGMSSKPHIQYDEATGKNFRPAPGIPNATSYAGVVDGQGFLKNPVYARARNDFKMRNDPKSTIGQNRNAYAQYLKETGGLGDQSFDAWKKTPSTNRGSINQKLPVGAPKGLVAPTPNQAFNSNAPASVVK